VGLVSSCLFVGLANLLVTIVVTLEKDEEFSFGEWFSEGDGSALRKVRGFRGAKWYQMVFAMRLPPRMPLEDLQKQEVPRSYLAMLWFDGEEVSVDELRKAVETSLAKKAEESSVMEEVGVWRLKKVMGDVNDSL
jgi:hypothetical protein